MPFPVIAAVAAGAAIAKGVSGLVKANRGRKREARGERMMARAWKKRTDYQIPDVINASARQAENEAFGRPAVMDYMEAASNKELSSNLSTIKRYATSSNDALAAASGANEQAGNRMLEASIAGAQARQDNMQSLYHNRAVLADFKTMQWDLNVNQPFLQRMEIAQSLIGGGRAERNAGSESAINGFTSAAQSFASMGAGGGGGIGGGMGMGGK